MKIKAFTSRYVNREYIVPAAFLVLSFAAWQFSGLSGSFVTNQVITRFIRDGLLVLSLIIPVVAGMGLNFAITVGAMSIQTALLVMIAYNIEGIPGILLTIVFGTAIAILTGYLIGRILNRVKGKEMITTIIIGFFANSIYQLIFLVGFGTVIPVANQDIILTRGIGVRNTVDLSMYRNTIDKLWMIQIGSIEIPLFMILVMLLFAGIIYYILHTRFGQQIKAVGSAAETSAILGIDTDKVRIKVMILSTVLAGLGQLIYLQNIGMFDVYTAHLNTDVISCAALLAGGASIKDAKIRHALLGIFLFHTLFIVSPQAGQNLFNNAALGEYFRSFVAYGTIAFALIMNIKNEKR
ncbi:MAG TPA: ABC transporter permease [Syntrophomonadaceae bacterium]|jgi:simple sugar transport system permease protein|nr:ABC transporter permease [Syntrophomonadaceae bacterium]HRX21528.1 ABC transporter permease [Syntrophomonadaceae bacterium]